MNLSFLSEKKKCAIGEVFESDSIPWWQKDGIIMERAVQHKYSCEDQKWTASDVLVRLERTPFGRGASRQAYRLKYINNDEKNCILPEEGIWEKAKDFVVKSPNTDDGTINNEEDPTHTFNFVRLQQEAEIWARQFSLNALSSVNDGNLVLGIIPATVIELTSHPGRPVLSGEEYFSKSDDVSNEKEDFVIIGSDTLSTLQDFTRQTSIAYFLFSWYGSGGLSMVVHMEGVGTTYTNPQV